MCLPSLIVPQVNLSITYESGVELETWNGIGNNGNANFDDFTCYFAEDG